MDSKKEGKREGYPAPSLKEQMDTRTVINFFMLELVTLWPFPYPYFQPFMDTSCGRWHDHNNGSIVRLRNNNSMLLFILILHTSFPRPCLNFLPSFQFRQQRRSSCALLCVVPLSSSCKNIRSPLLLLVSIFIVIYGTQHREHFRAGSLRPNNRTLSISWKIRLPSLVFFLLEFCSLAVMGRPFPISNKREWNDMWEHIQMPFLSLFFNFSSPLVHFSFFFLCYVTMANLGCGWMEVST